MLAEPLTIAEKALEPDLHDDAASPALARPADAGDERGQGLSALVLGIGPVGLLGAMALATAGLTTYVYSRELPPSPRIDLVTPSARPMPPPRPTTFPDLARR